MERKRGDLFFGTNGPENAAIVIVGEAWGQEEQRHEQPFVGTSGNELDRILSEAGIRREDCLATNVAAYRPPRNDFYTMFRPKTSSEPRVRGLLPGPEVQSEVSRLYAQLLAHPRKVVIGVGNYALWALSQYSGSAVIREKDGRPVPLDLQTWVPSGIMDYRGSMLFCDPITPNPQLSKTPFLPIIHPAAIMRAWSNRAVTVHDLKSRVPMALRGDWRPSPEPLYWAPPSHRDGINRLRHWRSKADSRLTLACDIETARGLITCIGLSDSPSFAMSIPFVRKREDGSFDSWWTPYEEAELLAEIRALLGHPKIRLVGQNFIYDTQYIQHWFALTPRLDFDTMLAQNVLFPGTPKDLGYLSSLYCQYHFYWKEDHKEWNLSGTVEQLLRYNCIDCTRTWEVADSQRQLLKALGMEAQMELKMKINRLCLRMMNKGVRIDKARRAALLMDLDQSASGLRNDLLHIIPQDFVKPGSETYWFNSAQQKNHLLYDILGLKRVLHRKTGNTTGGKSALRELEKRYPELSGLFTRLDYMGSVANTSHVIRTPLDPDSRMRCSFNPGGTETHRLSSSENAFGRGTNLQNLTKGEEE